jgi:hypothetical protein
MSTITSNDRICRLCCELFDQNISKFDDYEHLDDLWNLEEAAKSCATCNLMFLAVIQSATAITLGEESVTRIDDAFEILVPFARERGYIIERPCRMVVSCRDISFTKTTFRIEGQFKKSTDFDWSIASEESKHGLSLGHILLHNGPGEDTDFYLTPLVPRVNDEELVQHLKNCLPSLATDNYYSWEAPLPRRVLDLGEPNINNTLSSQQADLSLRETAGELGVYLTLSYCWGPYTNYRSLKANLDARKHNIVFDELPLVFQQAIVFTRALQIRYLWIDALCIVQDDRDDFAREIVIMDDIYKWGFCRIAITNCKAPTESFWPPNPIATSVKLPVDISVKNKPGSISRFVTLPKSYQRDVDYGYLNKRGWVLQERLLSPRTIHFTQDHIYYEDEDEIIAEDGVTGHFQWHSSIDKTKHISRRDLFPRKGMEKWESIDMTAISRDPWLKVAEAFSKTRLTRLTDKIVALFGLVKEFQRIQDYEDTVSMHEYMHLEDSTLWRKLQLDDCPSIDGEFSQGNQDTSNQVRDSSSNGYSTADLSEDWRINLNEDIKIRDLHLRPQGSDDFEDFSQHSHREPYSVIGVRQNELHIDLIWAARGDRNLQYQDILKLPSWTWLSYNGPVKFTKDQRPSSDVRAVLSSPVSEIIVVDLHVPPEPVDLPATEISYLQLSGTLLDSFTFSSEFAAPVDTRPATWDDLTQWSPFAHHPQSSTVPIFLSTISRCRKLFGSIAHEGSERENGKHVGYISFDDDKNISDTQGLCLIHISTLVDQIWLPPPKSWDNKIDYLPPGLSDDHGILDVYVAPTPPILAYALVLKKSKAHEGEYTRIGVAEVNYEWISSGRNESIRIV